MTAGTAVEAVLEVHGASHPLSEVIEHNLLRIAREALANAIKHAEARRVLIELTFDQQNLRLRVEDNGCGFNVGASGSAGEGGFGLISMRERADQIKGALSLDSEPGRGTRVSVTVPY
jgi:signal transduction histidine kinase